MLAAQNDRGLKMNSADVRRAERQCELAGWECWQCFQPAFSAVAWLKGPLECRMVWEGVAPRLFRACHRSASIIMEERARAIKGKFFQKTWQKQ
jgi:hypothetical protein